MIRDHVEGERDQRKYVRETPIALIIVGPVFADRCSRLSNCGFFVYIFYHPIFDHKES
jgi:hypothetical protein